MKIDKFFKFKGYWVWLYSGLYYPMIIATVLTIDTMKQYNYSFMSFVFLLFIQMAFFRYYPVETPADWRDFSEIKQTRSVRFIQLVQKYDDNTNCFPSMHVSVATLVAFHIANNVAEVGNLPFLFPVIIALSALWTKQHYVVDVVAGVVPGWIAWELYKLIQY
ncbi:MAG: phosphatase PAP2 family protein [archaeon]|jgi:membrane-associated phospholipid phosphatase|nr:phosphatase PAP2 family protein [archaeon]